MILSSTLPTTTQAIPRAQTPPAPKDGDEKFGAPKEQITPNSNPGQNKTDGSTTDSAQKKNPGPIASLTEPEVKMVEKLKKRDMEVKRHEQAHLTAAGGLARGSASFSFQTGPDGKRYAIGGEVNIDIGREADPTKTLRKMQAVQKAATAPAQPSSKDMAVAAQARQAANEARSEIAEIPKELLNKEGSAAEPTAMENRNVAESYSAVMNAKPHVEPAINVMA